ncbi:MAG: HigA family addiction module antidote protein [Candidatus Eisenbacteria bacterium]|nr:HigA family addiction module antidote protein [Candidatus Eisenbacteria bacterium]
MTTEASIHSDLAIPPGEYLEEVVEELGMTKDELARRMSRPASKLSPIFKGEKAITPDTALQLETVLGVPAHVWLGLESEYRLTLARRENEAELQRMRDESKLVTSYCYAELVKAGVVAKTTRPLEKVQELRRFFGVASLFAIPNLRRYQVAFRQGAAKSQRRSSEAIAAWLRLAEHRALAGEAVAFDRPRLRAALPSIRGLTTLDPEVFVPELTEVLADAGVAFVILPHFPGTGVHGATFRSGRGVAVLAMTIRGAWADIFWFSLFHELGHLLLHDKRDVILESDDTDPLAQEREAQADAFARDALIDPRDYERFVRRDDFMSPSVKRFAAAVGLAPGIVVGRLQHDGHLRHKWGNDLRVRYKWTSSAA